MRTNGTQQLGTELVHRVVYSGTKDRTILDPFMGSGTRAAVAKKLGRNYIAADIQFSQLEITRKRLAEVQQELFI